jgi:hypothetical protein
MLNLLAMFQHHGIGFFGQEGPLWFFLGLVFLVVVVAISFKIFNLLLPALGGRDEGAMLKRLSLSVQPLSWFLGNCR